MLSGWSASTRSATATPKPAGWCSTQPAPYTILFAATLGFGERIRTRMEERVARRVGLPWSTFDIPSQLHRLDAPPPLLLVHDPLDRETRYADSLAVRRVWPGATLITVRDLGHWRILRDQDTIAHATAFIAPSTERVDPGRIA